MNITRSSTLLLIGLVAVCSVALYGARRQDAEERRERQAFERLLAAPAFAVIRDADRVEALPVEMAGAGLSGVHRVVERPVLLDSATARDMRNTLSSATSFVGGPMACIFQPMLALRFHKGRDSVQALICFLCQEVVFEKPGGEHLAGKLTLSDSVVARLSAVAKKLR